MTDLLKLKDIDAITSYSIKDKIFIYFSIDTNSIKYIDNINKRSVKVGSSSASITESNLPPSGNPGSDPHVYLDTSTGNLYTWNGSSWTNISGGAGATNLSYTVSSVNGIVTSDTGLDATIPLATNTNAGLQNPTDFTKLSNITITQAVDIDSLKSDVTDLITLTGVAENATNLGSFTGSIITDNSTIKTALQEIETALSGQTTVNGGVIFGNGTTQVQDASNFFYDDVNNRLGVGTNTPLSKIHVTGDGNNTPNNAGVRLENNGTLGRSFMLSSRSDGGITRCAISDETAGAERASLGINGFLGIGETNPQTKLHVKGDGNSSANNVAIRFQSDGGSGRTWNIGTRGDGGTQRFYISDETGAAERFGIDSSGRTWVGQGAAPQIIPGYGNAGLNVISIAGSDGMSVKGPGANNAVNIYNPTGGDTTLISFITDDGGTGQKGRVHYISATDTLNYATTSDQRLKTDTGKEAKGLEDLLKIKVRNYDWKSGGNQDGMFAQELNEIVPSAVSVGSDELNEEGNLKNPWAVDYGKLTPILIKAVQELTAKVKELEAGLNSKIF